TPSPPEGLPYYGSWADRDEVHLGSASQKAARGTVAGVTMPDPRDVRIAELEARLKERGIEWRE
ncbi:MAG: hypothetical protein QOD06_2951, partial [Candidatus Binatota bacterium]|nr:hypothetical protein [Candidatus Binatota bacterium]